MTFHVLRSSINDQQKSTFNDLHDEFINYLTGLSQ